MRSRAIRSSEQMKELDDHDEAEKEMGVVGSASCQQIADSGGKLFCVQEGQIKEKREQSTKERERVRSSFLGIKDHPFVDGESRQGEKCGLTVLEHFKAYEVCQARNPYPEEKGGQSKRQRARSQQVGRELNEEIIEGRLALNLKGPLGDFAPGSRRYDPPGAVFVDPQVRSCKVVETQERFEENQACRERQGKIENDL